VKQKVIAYDNTLKSVQKPGTTQY